MKALCQLLLLRRHTVCLMARADDWQTIACYQRLGFEPVVPDCVVRYHQ